MLGVTHHKIEAKTEPLRAFPSARHGRWRNVERDNATAGARHHFRFHAGATADDKDGFFGLSWPASQARERWPARVDVACAAIRGGQTPNVANLVVQQEANRFRIAARSRDFFLGIHRLAVELDLSVAIGVWRRVRHWRSFRGNGSRGASALREAKLVLLHADLIPINRFERVVDEAGAA